MSAWSTRHKKRKRKERQAKCRHWYISITDRVTCQICGMGWHQSNLVGYLFGGPPGLK